MCVYIDRRLTKAEDTLGVGIMPVMVTFHIRSYIKPAIYTLQMEPMIIVFDSY